ncbi:GNAT family N-acetyltransferase [Paenibacillus sp. HWE-109]|uniref:GNAT family N-acetyltransferase n=1 Tax=Paenibacillus sp. HWE-109 TaxID=1306526 RepID=UPI001EE113B4|nr:GNAT family N-acetyltransferase [Paenibacillus sp. HWE-109]UKS29241.1 GNAT family N-acetyltransferase [Paenibacillus sp. HWE-109]
MTWEYMTTETWDEALWLQAESVYNEAFPKHGRKPRELIRRMFQRGICTLHIWRDPTQVVAMALTATNQETKVLIIDYIAVRKSQRGKGLGRTCLADIRHWAKTQGNCRELVIEVEAEMTEENIARIAFWQKVGFHLTDYVHTYVWVPETYRAMYLDLDEQSELPDDGQTLFTHITDYHEKAYRGRG